MDQIDIPPVLADNGYAAVGVIPQGHSMIKMPNGTHRSNEMEMSAKEVSPANGSAAMIPVYTPARIAKRMILFQVRSVARNLFLCLSCVSPSKGPRLNPGCAG